MRWAPIVVTSAVSLLTPGGAFALVLAPPGQSGVSQYVEVIPTSSGNAGSPGGVTGSANVKAGSKALAHLGQGRTGDTRLASLGKDGQAAAAVAAATAPSPVRRANGHHGTSGSLKGAGVDSSQGAS